MARAIHLMRLPWLVGACVLAFACDPAAKKKSDDPTVVAEDLDQPVDLTITPRGAFWTTQPVSVSFGGSGKPSSLQFVPADGGDVQDVLTTLIRASALTSDDQFLYWLDAQSDGKQRLNRMDFEANERTTLIDFGTFTDDVPTEGTRLIPFRGRLYWGGVKKVWVTALDGGAPEWLVRARPNGGSLMVVLVDESGVYFQEHNQALGTDLKHVSLAGQGFEPEPIDAGVVDAGVMDAGADAGASDGGAAWPPEAPGVELIRRGVLWSGARGVAIRDPWLYWFNAALLGGTLMRAPLVGGPDDEVLQLPSNTSPTDLASDGEHLVFTLSSNAGGGLYEVVKNQRQELYRLGLLNGGTPRALRLDETSAWFFAGAERGARLHRVFYPTDAGMTDAGTADAGP